MTMNKKQKLIVFLLALGVLIYIAYGLCVSYVRAIEIQRSIIAQEEEKKRIEEMSVLDIINAYGGSHSVTIANIAKCESSLNPKAINYHDGGYNKHSVGVLQYQESTFLGWEKKYGEDLDYYSTLDQVKLTKFILDHNGGKNWTCFRQIYGVK